MAENKSSSERIVEHPPEGISVYREARLEIRPCSLSLSDESGEVCALMVHLGAVVRVPILEDGRIVMIQNRRWQVGHRRLELPAGT